MRRIRRAFWVYGAAVYWSVIAPTIALRAQSPEESSRKSLESAAATGNAAAQYALGFAAEKEGRPADALSWYRKAAAQTYPPAVARLAVLDPSTVRAFPAEANAAPPRQAVRDSRIAVFVGPLVRDGFVDVDSGVLDSIKDIKNELEGKKRVQIVLDKARAQVTLDVLSRGATSSGGGGAVAAPIGTMTFLMPIGTIGIATMLHAGSYEKPIVFQNCQGWRLCARLVAKDIEAWIDANNTLLDEGKPFLAR